MSERKSSGLMAVLHADGPATDRAEALALYGRFIGDWHADIVSYAPDGVRHQGQGEIHFDWILEGRAIQDVWMIPQQKDRVPHAPEMPVAGNWYGTTIRVYDPALHAWRIYWIDPATNSYRQQIGRPQGADIVQEGTTETGALSRWSFTEITPVSFHWKAEASMDKGTSWRLFVEVFAGDGPLRARFRTILQAPASMSGVRREFKSPQLPLATGAFGSNPVIQTRLHVKPQPMPANVREPIARHCNRQIIGSHWPALAGKNMERAMAIENTALESISISNQCVTNLAERCVRFLCERQRHAGQR